MYCIITFFEGNKSKRNAMTTTTTRKTDKLACASPSHFKSLYPFVWHPTKRREKKIEILVPHRIYLINFRHKYYGISFVPFCHHSNANVAYLRDASLCHSPFVFAIWLIHVCFSCSGVTSGMIVEERAQTRHTIKQTRFYLCQDLLSHDAPCRRRLLFFTSHTHRLLLLYSFHHFSGAIFFEFSLNFSVWLHMPKPQARTSAKRFIYGFIITFENKLATIRCD